MQYTKTKQHKQTWAKYNIHLEPTKHFVDNQSSNGKPFTKNYNTRKREEK